MNKARLPAKPATYVPALGFHRLTGLYDRVLSALLAEHSWKSRLVGVVAPQPGEVILDIGAGTGTLALKQACPDAASMGIEPDPAVLERAHVKIEESKVEISLEEGYANQLPYWPESVDKVVSSLVFHHLPREAKAAAFAEANRVLKPGGRIYIADCARLATGACTRLFFLVQLLDGFATTEDNRRGLLPSFMRDAGFEAVAEIYCHRTVFGTLVFLEGHKASAGGT